MLHFSWILGAIIRQTNSLRIAWSLLRFCTRKVYDVRKLRWHNWDSEKQLMRITMRVVYIMLHVYYMAHLNKLSKSIKSKRLPCSGDVIYFQRCRVRHNANYVANAQISGYISWPSTVICLHYKSYRAELRRSGPSPPPLCGPGPHDIWVGRARSEAFTLHQTGLGPVPSPVKLYSVNGAYDTSAAVNRLLIGYTPCSGQKNQARKSNPMISTYCCSKDTPWLVLMRGYEVQSSNWREYAKPHTQQGPIYQVIYCLLMLCSSCVYCNLSTDEA